MENPVSIDLIIPVYKPDSKFLELMNNILEQTYMPSNIILINTVDKKDIDNKNILDSFINYEKVKLSKCKVQLINIEKQEFDHGGTRNFGASLSKSDICMFMTQDAIPANKFLVETMVQALENEQVASCYARQLPHEEAKTLERFSRSFNYPQESRIKSKKDKSELGIKTYFCSNVCAAYKKDIYESLGGFVTQTIFNEDMIMAYKIIENNYSIMYCGDACVYHSHNYSYIEQLKRNFDLAVSQVEYDYVFQSVKSESEGIKFVVTTIKGLVKKKEILLIPSFIIESAFKYIGFKLGKSYKKLPLSLIKKISLNPSYWNKKHKSNT